MASKASDADPEVKHCATLRDEEAADRNCDPACFTAHQDDSSRNVTEKGAERNDERDPFGGEAAQHVTPEVAPPSARAVAAGEPSTTTPTTSDEALKLAIKLAIDAGEYDRAAVLLDVARRAAPKLGTITPIASARFREP